MKLIVGMTGASGVVIAVELLRRLKELENVETHLIITEGAATKRTLIFLKFDALQILFTTLIKWTPRLPAGAFWLTA